MINSSKFVFDDKIELSERVCARVKDEVKLYIISEPLFSGKCLVIQLTSYNSEFIKGEKLTNLLSASINTGNTLQYGTGGQHKVLEV